MERDRLISTARELTTQLNELHKALAQLGVTVDVRVDQSSALFHFGANTVSAKKIAVSYTQTL